MCRFQRTIIECFIIEPPNKDLLSLQYKKNPECLQMQSSREKIYDSNAEISQNVPI